MTSDQISPVMVTGSLDRTAIMRPYVEIVKIETDRQTIWRKNNAKEIEENAARVAAEGAWGGWEDDPVGELERAVDLAARKEVDAGLKTVRNAREEAMKCDWSVETLDVLYLSFLNEVRSYPEKYENFVVDSIQLLQRDDARALAEINWQRKLIEKQKHERRRAVNQGKWSELSPEAFVDMAVSAAGREAAKLLQGLIDAGVLVYAK